MGHGVWLIPHLFSTTGCLGPWPAELQSCNLSVWGTKPVASCSRCLGNTLRYVPQLSARREIWPKDLFRSVTRHMYGLEVEIQWRLQLVTGWQLWPWFSEDRETWCKATAVLLCSPSPSMFLFSYLISLLILCLWGRSVSGFWPSII